MVSKIAVIALVAIISVPILLGYAFNLTQVTETEYKPTGEEINVTQLIQNGVAYSDTHGNTYQNNSDYITLTNTPTIPRYNTTTTTNTSFKGKVISTTGSTLPSDSAWIGSYESVFYYQASYAPSSGGSITAQLNIYNTDTNQWLPTVSLANFHSAYYDFDTKMLYYTVYVDDQHVISASVNYFHSIAFTAVGSYSGDTYSVYSVIGENYYLDISSGYYFEGPSTTGWTTVFPGNPNSSDPGAKSCLVSMNLDSITDSNYELLISDYLYSFKLTKATDGGGNVSWIMTAGADNYDLYYDPSRSDNTYQFLISVEKVSSDASYNYAVFHTEARYIGGWNTIIGESNYYIKYTFDENVNYPASYEPQLTGFHMLTASLTPVSRSPTIRIDDSIFAGISYYVIQDKEYRPAAMFGANCKTTITKPTMIGTSLSFGGNTYTVIDGEITLGTHKASVNGLELESVLSSSGVGYDNRINGITVSTTADPSTITFNGSWSASVVSTAQDTNTYTKTEWTAGKFGWDGMDQNFLMVGLITCLGVFVALGIYARKKGSGGIIPLMIVTGCAAALFFIML